MTSPKKAAKKAAKKSAKHKDTKQHEVKDLRRAYEHLGRVEFLAEHLPASSHSDVATLTSLAQKQLAEGKVKNSAELLRAAEHLSFAALVAPSGKNGDLGPAVVQAVEIEFQHLFDSAQEHWEDSVGHDRAVATIFKSCLQNSQMALSDRAYRRALEFVRAAGALAKVEHSGAKALQARRGELLLTAR
jgi:hypothetical protein